MTPSELAELERLEKTARADRDVTEAAAAWQALPGALFAHHRDLIATARRAQRAMEVLEELSDDEGLTHREKLVYEALRGERDE